MKHWTTYRDQVLAEWRTSRRLRLAALLALAVAGGHLLTLMSEDRSRLAEEYRREAALLERLIEASREEAWPTRADEAEARLAGMRQSVPEMSSSGLAQAELQAWLTALASQNGLANPRVRVETSIDVPGQPELWQVLARLDAEGTQSMLGPFLAGLAAARPWIQADQLDVQRDSRLAGSVRAGLVVRGYYRKPAREAGPAPSGDDASLGLPAGDLP